MDYDFLVAGCGLYGAVFARKLTDNGMKVLCIDSRDHIGGN
nr:NAD(P)-binding protein [Lachnospiraceae bacterium]